MTQVIESGPRPSPDARRTVAARVQRGARRRRSGRALPAARVGGMPTIYFDGSAALDPAILDRLAHLADAGHRLVLVAPADHPAAGATAWFDRTASMPAEPPRGSWFLTADPATCHDRQPGLRTVLIGPRENGPRPTRCDTTARDLREAVLEILAADAMS